ncbi:hypothetical protein JL721_10867 [Aureococcus anophagefferens]|nr:hypothetical protein JL721_10867 [Aureococcus anophagefferens]
MGAGQVTAIHIEDRSGRCGVVPPPLAEPIAGPPPASRAAIRRVPLVRVQADDLRKDSNEARCLATDEAAFERGRERRSRLEGRRVRVRRSEVERMSVRALKDIIGAVGMTTRGCFERGDLVKRVLESSSVDVVPETVHEMTRSSTP